MGEQTPESTRIVSLDQFRGYTVLGMFWVNFVGAFAVTPLVFRHVHTFCSYADTIMPHFFFAVGFAYRLTLQRALAKQGAAAAYTHVIKRNLGLLLVAVVVHHIGSGGKSWAELQKGLWGFLEAGFKREYFQTLVHIAVTSIWVMPVIARGPMIRIAWMVGSCVAHVLLSQWFNYEWVNANPKGIDGGPLGFLTWTVPLLLGSLAWDAVSTGDYRKALRPLVLWGILVMLLGYGLSCVNRVTPPNSLGEDWRNLLIEPPFVPPTQPVNMWNMSQRSGSVSYLVFSGGLSLVVYALFVWLCDLQKWQWGLFRTLGTNALAAYILHGMVMEAIKPWVPRDAPLWYVLASFGVFLAITWLILRYMEKHKLYLRL